MSIGGSASNKLSASQEKLIIIQQPNRLIHLT